MDETYRKKLIFCTKNVQLIETSDIVVQMKNIHFGSIAQIKSVWGNLGKHIRTIRTIAINADDDSYCKSSLT